MPDSTAASVTGVFTAPPADGARWPADRQADGFAARPPERPEGRPASFEPRDPAAQRDSSPGRGGRAGMSPSGTFDRPEPPGTWPGASDSYPGLRTPGRSPGGSRAEIDYPDRRSDDRRPDYSGRDYPPGNAGRPARRDYPPASGYESDSGTGYGGEPAAPRAPGSHRRHGGRGDGAPGGRPDDRIQASRWPEDQPGQGWPQDDGWRDQSWPGQDQDDLEALPPSGEVHHDWPGRRDRAGRGWPAPDSDTGGERR
jgi:hypothetical protein